MNRVDARWDVFLSYARSDQAQVKPIVDALRAQRLRVFVDEAAVDDFDSISQVISRELASSLVLLAYYSVSYPTRRACQWELTAAYLAGQREGAPHRRVLVINPEHDADHIHPLEIRDARAPRPTGDLADFAAKVAAQTARLAGPIGDVETLTPVRWLPAPPRVGSPSFVGRLGQLWQLHSALHPHAAPLMTGRSAASAVVVRGAPGTGKTLLAEEYAVRFSAAFPGGVYWFNLADDPVTGYERQIRTVCGALGVAPGGSVDDALSSLAVELERRHQPCLWVVDGVPAGLPEHHARRYLAPHPFAATLLTTRGSYPQLAVTIALGADPLARPANAGVRAAAFELQVELATRVGVQSLADDQGRLREALASLYSLVGTTRAVLRRHGPEPAGDVQVIAGELVNDVLRPFLSRWHGELSAHEELRPPHLGGWQHERLWADAGDLREQLRQLHEPLRELLNRLARISGSDFGL